MEIQALTLTLRLAAVTTLLLLAVAVPLAWWIARIPEGRRGIGRAVVQAVVALPLVLPPTVVGFYLLVGLGPLTAVGRMIAKGLGHPLAFSFTGLLVGAMIFSLPFAVQPMVAGFRGSNRDIWRRRRVLGWSPRRIFLWVGLPMARASLLTSAVLTFAHTVGEFGVVLMVGGNIPGVTRTLSIALYDQVQDGDYGAAGRLSVMLLGFSVVALVIIYLRSATRWRVDGE